MLQDPGVLPEWMVVGLAFGVLASVGVGALFWLANRWFPVETGSRRRVTAESRKREELRAYLRAIDEPFVEDGTVAGQPVAFYLPDRDVAITFDARDYFRLQHTDTYPVLVEHEMPGVHLGARLPFETPDVSFGRAAMDREDRRPIVEAYGELGLSSGATPEEVRAAYRRRVKEVHPDLGGDEADFRRVREAYTTASQHATQPARVET